MSRERFELTRTQFDRALTRLSEALNENETSFMRDAVIQRFEFTYELSWKCLFYWLRDNGEKVPEVVRPVIQAAFKAGLIDDADQWERIKKYRDETSHAYDEGKAIEVAGFIRSHAESAFTALSKKLAGL